MNADQIGQVCHETNRAYCETIGDHSQKTWESAEPWQREATTRGVLFRLENPDAPISSQHDDWVNEKLADGWAYGPVKDAGAKTHPCICPYEALPVEQRLKDYLFVCVVEAFRKAAAAG